MKKIILYGGFILVMFLIFITLVSAHYPRFAKFEINLNGTVSEVVKSSFPITNTNDFEITIEFSSSGDVEDYLSFEDNIIILAPHQKKEIPFKIYLAHENIKNGVVHMKIISVEGSSSGYPIFLSIDSSVQKFEYPIVNSPIHLENVPVKKSPSLFQLLKNKATFINSLFFQ